jgi:hypothetical protein
MITWETKNSSEEIRLSRAKVELNIQENEMKLINNLATKLWISRESTDKLIKFDTSRGIDALKEELSSIKVEEKKFDEKNEIDEIVESIQRIQNLQRALTEKSRIEIASLRDWIKLEKSDDYKIASNSYAISNKLFSSELLNKIENPEHLWHNLVWAFIWSIDTIYKALIYTKDLAIWIAKSPVDLYKLLRKELK